MKYTYEIVSDNFGKFALTRTSKTFFGKIKTEYHYNNTYGGPWWCKDTSDHQWACWREPFDTLKAFKNRYEISPDKSGPKDQQ